MAQWTSVVMRPVGWIFSQQILIEGQGLEARHEDFVQTCFYLHHYLHLFPGWHNSETNELLLFVFGFRLERHQEANDGGFFECLSPIPIMGAVENHWKEKVCPPPISFAGREFTFNFRKGLFSQTGTLYQFKFVIVCADCERPHRTEIEISPAFWRKEPRLVPKSGTS